MIDLKMEEYIFLVKQAIFTAAIGAFNYLAAKLATI